MNDPTPRGVIRQPHDHHYAAVADVETCQVPDCTAVMYWRLHRALSQGGRRRR